MDWKSQMSHLYSGMQGVEPIFYEAASEIGLGWPPLSLHPELLELLRQTNGIDEAMVLGNRKIVTRNLVMGIEAMMKCNQSLPKIDIYSGRIRGVIIIASAGQDGILYGVNEENKFLQIEPMEPDKSSRKIAEDLHEFLGLVVSGEL